MYFCRVVFNDITFCYNGYNFLILKCITSRSINTGRLINPYELKKSQKFKYHVY